MPAIVNCRVLLRNRPGEPTSIRASGYSQRSSLGVEMLETSKYLVRSALRGGSRASDVARRAETRKPAGTDSRRSLFGPYLLIRLPEPDHPATASGWRGVVLDASS